LACIQAAQIDQKLIGFCLNPKTLINYWQTRKINE
jgi:hypothetical protein